MDIAISGLQAKLQTLKKSASSTTITTNTERLEGTATKKGKTMLPT